ncbi:olfactory receptor 49-like [Corythoichthys intestinalis]|uniref:olfactory receptor 49-like n=1 Tax=Corythoichthys intestinalis TaxID=161448 RepID=UPI0025A5F09C|nr:olfactory receptor 49-like [Corythoichthys intestinalis]XP_061795699.1 olfactory receptor 6E1-like [Nerophis lumbriciformis]
MMENVSVITMITLSGLNFPFWQRIIIFVLVLLCYLVILFNNLIIIVLIITDRKLHKPMYVFLCNLCVNALYGSVAFYPKLLADLLSSHVISVVGCMLQGYTIHTSIACDFSILALIAYDRYVALCRPLIYESFMTKQKVSLFIFVSWLLPTFCMVMNSMSLMSKKLCRSHIDRLYCVNLMISKLTCTPAKAYSIISLVNISFFFGIFWLIVYSYVHLIKMCIHSPQMWKKFRQTCTPHFICLLIYTITELVDLFYMRLGSGDLSVHLHNLMTMEFLIIPPIMNPLVYGLQLTHIRNKIFRFFHSKKKLQHF